MTKYKIQVKKHIYYGQKFIFKLLNIKIQIFLSTILKLIIQKYNSS